MDPSPVVEHDPPVFNMMYRGTWRYWGIRASPEGDPHTGGGVSLLQGLGLQAPGSGKHIIRIAQVWD